MFKNLYQYLVIKQSGLFNQAFYLLNNPDVRKSDVNPIMHYIKYGWKEGRNPSEKFNTTFYLEANKNLKAKQINPLVHYIKHVHKNTTTAEQQGDLYLTAMGNSYADSYQQQLIVCTTKTHPDFVPEQEYTASNLNFDVKLIAFYLPQYHPIPENDAWWGKGFTEWTNVSKAVPQFLGHYQPRLPGELGFYDLRVPEIQRRQVELAQKYGIHGFCFHYYWFNGKRLLQRPLDQFINDPNINFPFCICWANENWTRKWDGYINDVLIAQDHSFNYDKHIIEDWIFLFTNPNYIRIQDRPLLIIYRPDIFTDLKQTISYWRKFAIKNGENEPFILAAQTFGYHDPSPDGFDGAIEFPPHNLGQIPQITGNVPILNPEFTGHIFYYADFVDDAISRMKKENFKQFRTIMPGWDNQARRPGSGMTFHKSTPEAYGRWLRAACKYTVENLPQEERLVFINAWNEWAEGAHLEPDQRFGYAYLQKTNEVLHSLT